MSVKRYCNADFFFAGFSFNRCRRSAFSSAQASSTYPGGSVEHTNEEPGSVWLQRLLTVYPSAIWLNPQPESLWNYHESIGLTRELMGERMFPLTLEGLDRGMRLLTKAH
jgi:uncharacterized protein with von Willebrand factor type A (vWA) domain